MPEHTEAEDNVEPGMLAEGWPELLYKYRSLRPGTADMSRLIDIIDGRIWAAHRKDFNDPFDCAPVLDPITDQAVIADHAKAVVNKYASHVSRTERRLQRKTATRNLRKIGMAKVARMSFDRTYDEMGIVSLSRRPDDLLMWGHYASDHTGVCLEFSLVDPRSYFRRAFDVEYVIKRPIIVFPSFDSNDLFKKSFLTKAKCWEYEEEWRALDNSGPGLKSYSKRDLHGIIFGAQCAPHDIAQITEHVKNRPVRLMTASLDDREYKIDIDPPVSAKTDP